MTENQRVIEFLINVKDSARVHADDSRVWFEPRYGTAMPPLIREAIEEAYLQGVRDTLALIQDDPIE